MTKIVETIINKNFVEAKNLVDTQLKYIAEKKLVEVKKMIAARNLTKQEEEQIDEAKMTRREKDAAIRQFMSHDPEAGEKIIAMGKKDRAENKAFASAKKEIQRVKKKENIEEENIDESTEWAQRFADRYHELKDHKNPEVRKHAKAAMKSYDDDQDTAEQHMRMAEKETRKKVEQIDEARFKIVKARIRGGKIQRRKKVSTQPGMTFRGGKLIRMSPAEKRRRKLGARRGKLKRRAKMSGILRKRKMSLMKRERLGI